MLLLRVILHTMWSGNSLQLLCMLLCLWFQRLQPARGGTAQRKIFLLGKLESSHPSRTFVKSIEVFMESSQS